LVDFASEQGAEMFKDLEEMDGAIALILHTTLAV